MYSTYGGKRKARMPRNISEPHIFMFVVRVDEHAAVMRQVYVV